jgi:hypothetical protein
VDNIGIIGISSKPTEPTVNDTMGKVGGSDGVVVGAAPPGAKAGWKFDISRRGFITGGK